MPPPGKDASSVCRGEGGWDGLGGPLWSPTAWGRFIGTPRDCVSSSSTCHGPQRSDEGWRPRPSAFGFDEGSLPLDSKLTVICLCFLMDYILASLILRIRQNVQLGKSKDVKTALHLIYCS